MQSCHDAMNKAGKEEGGMYPWLPILLLVCTSVFFFWSSPVLGFERFDVVTSEELSDLMVNREKGEGVDFLLINTLDRLIYNDQSIPGSINIPWAEIEKYKETLGEDKNKLIITYCMGYR